MATKAMTVFRQGGEDYTINDPNIADEFSSSVAYNAGTYVNYQGNLYIFTANHVAGAWNASHVRQVNLGEEVSEISEEVSGIKSAIGNTALPTTAQTLTGAIAEHEDDLTNQQGQITDQQGQITDIKSAVTDQYFSIKKTALDHVPIGNLLENTWLNTNGVEERAVGWEATLPIKLREGDSFVCIYTSVQTDWVWFYDENNVKTDKRTAKTGITYIDVPANSVYMRVSNTNAGMESLIIYDNNKISLSETSGYIDTGKLVAGVWIGVDGSEQTDAEWSSTPFVEFPTAYTRIIVEATVRSDWNRFYDENKDPIGDRFSVETGINSYNIPHGAKYVRLSNVTAALQNTKIYGDGAIIDKLYSLVERNGNDNVPEYYEQHILSKAKTICGLIANAPDGDSFVFITDIHDKSNVMNSPALVRNICKMTGVSTIFLNGDYINSYSARNDALEKINEICSLYRCVGVDTYIAIGNHEYNNPTASDTPEALAKEISETQMQSVLRPIRKMVVSDPNSLSYYYDNEFQKIRYFVGEVNRGSDLVPKSIKWIASQVLDVPSGYSVVVFFHTILTLSNGVAALNGQNAQGLANILDAIKNHTSVTYDGTTYDYSSPDFIAKGIELVAAFCGDYHMDLDYTTTGGVKIIMTTCDSYAQQWSVSGQAPRPTGTYEEQAFDVVTIDKANDVKKIYMTRVGAGEDREYNY